MAGKRRPWTDGESEMAVRLRGEGRTYEQIGAAIGRSRSQVHSHLNYTLGQRTSTGKKPVADPIVSAGAEENGAFTTAEFERQDDAFAEAMRQAMRKGQL